MEARFYHSNPIKNGGYPADTMFHIKDPGSSITHFIGFICAILATPGLLIYGSSRHIGLSGLISLSVFMVSMVLLYGASTAYHTFIVQPYAEKVLKRIDHMMIFVLIAGSYTPICVIVLGHPTGTVMMTIIWGLAFAGMVLKLFWVTCPKWFSSIIYIAMGWACVFIMPQLYVSLSHQAFLFLALGGIIYTIGGVIYAMKLRLFNERFPKFGSHEVFHVCVMLGSLCHYFAIASVI